MCSSMELSLSLLWWSSASSYSWTTSSLFGSSRGPHPLDTPPLVLRASPGQHTCRPLSSALLGKTRVSVCLRLQVLHLHDKRSSLLHQRNSAHCLTLTTYDPLGPRENTTEFPLSRIRDSEAKSLPTSGTWNIMSFNPFLLLLLDAQAFLPVVVHLGAIRCDVLQADSFGTSSTNVSCCNMSLGITDSATPKSIVTFQHPCATNTIDDLVGHEDVQATDVKIVSSASVLVFAFALLLSVQLLKPILHDETKRGLYGRRKPMKPATRTVTARATTSQPRTNKCQSLCLPPCRSRVPNCWRLSKEVVLGGVSDTWTGHVLVCHNDCTSQSLAHSLCLFFSRPVPSLCPTFCRLSLQVPLPCPLSSLPFPLRSAAIICIVTQASKSIATISPSNSANVLLFHANSGVGVVQSAPGVQQHHPLFLDRWVLLQTICMFKDGPLRLVWSHHHQQLDTGRVRDILPVIAFQSLHPTFPAVDLDEEVLSLLHLSRVHDLQPKLEVPQRCLYRSPTLRTHGA